jgi:leader peptidase (prepilin peptidase)/N-methyltransferase
VSGDGLPPFPLPGWFFPLWATLFGLIFGSFANVCIHRLPDHRSVIRPRSSCPGCGALVRAKDNIPIFSWLWLRGRCRSCGMAIPARYPLVEALAGALFLALALRYGPSAGFAVAAGYALALLILFFTDLETFLLPDTVTLTGTALGLACSPWNPLLGLPEAEWWERLLASAIGALTGAGLVFLIIMAWKLWVRGRLGADATEEEKSGMGWGDLKMLALIGSCVGWQQLIFVTFLASAMGSLAGLALMLAGRGGRKMVLPFGTFLSAAGIATIFVGPPAVRWYLALLGFP